MEESFKEIFSKKLFLKKLFSYFDNEFGCQNEKLVESLAEQKEISAVLHVAGLRSIGELLENDVCERVLRRKGKVLGILSVLH